MTTSRPPVDIGIGQTLHDTGHALYHAARLAATEGESTLVRWNDQTVAAVVPAGADLLAALVQAATADEIMAALRGLDTDRWLLLTDRMARINRHEYEGRPGSADDLDPADHAALIPASADETVNLYAGRIMDAIHADMAAGRVPADVGSFSALHDHVDANMYLIRLVPFDAADCNCTTPPAPTDEPGDQPYLHEDGCACHAEHGSEDRHVALGNAVSDEVSRRLAVEAAQLRAPRPAPPPPAVPPDREAWVRGHYTESVADYLLGGDGFKVTGDPARPALAREWTSIFAELAAAGLMHVTGSGRWRWNTPLDPAAGRGYWPEFGGRRCEACGLPVVQSGVLSREGSAGRDAVPVLVHVHGHDEHDRATALLNAHPHNVRLAGAPAPAVNRYGQPMGMLCGHTSRGGSDCILERGHTTDADRERRLHSDLVLLWDDEGYLVNLDGTRT